MQCTVGCLHVFILKITARTLCQEATKWLLPLHGGTARNEDCGTCLTFIKTHAVGVHACHVYDAADLHHVEQRDVDTYSFSPYAESQMTEHKLCSSAQPGAMTNNNCSVKLSNQIAGQNSSSFSQ